MAASMTSKPLFVSEMMTLRPSSGLLGFACLGLIGAALTYIPRFRGIARLEPSAVSTLGFLSPTTAVVLGWSVLHQSLSPAQILGMAVVLGSVWLSQRARETRVPTACASRSSVPTAL